MGMNTANLWRVALILAHAGSVMVMTNTKTLIQSPYCKDYIWMNIYIHIEGCSWLVELPWNLLSNAFTHSQPNLRSHTFAMFSHVVYPKIQHIWANRTFHNLVLGYAHPASLMFVPWTSLCMSSDQAQGTNIFQHSFPWWASKNPTL